MGGAFNKIKHQCIIKKQNKTPQQARNKWELLQSHKGHLKNFN